MEEIDKPRRHMQGLIAPAWSLSRDGHLDRTTRDGSYILHDVELLDAKITQGGVSGHLGRSALSRHAQPRHLITRTPCLN